MRNSQLTPTRSLNTSTMSTNGFLRKGMLFWFVDRAAVVAHWRTTRRNANRMVAVRDPRS